MCVYICVYINRKLYQVTVFSNKYTLYLCFILFYLYVFFSLYLNIVNRLYIVVNKLYTMIKKYLQ